MDLVLALLAAFVAWHVLRQRYQHTHISLLGQHLADLQLERHMETLTEGYLRAIHEAEETRQLQVLQSFGETERTVAAQVQSLADSMQNETLPDSSMGTLPFCVPYIERFSPGMTRDFRELLHIHAAGLRHVVDNEEHWDAKTRAYHLSAELYLLQHSCHWYCKSRALADARLIRRHQVRHQDVMDSVSAVTRSAYQQWLQSPVIASSR